MCLKRKVLLEAATLEAFRSGAKLGAFVMDEEAVQVAVWDDAAEEFVALTRLEQVPSKARLSLSVPTGRRGFGSQLAGVGAPRAWRFGVIVHTEHREYTREWACRVEVCLEPGRLFGLFDECLNLTGLAAESQRM